MHIKTTLLSEGSSSNVFLTEDSNYVMKEYKSFYSEQSRKKEVQILELLKCDSIVKLITSTDDYLILERLQTKDLFEVVKLQQLNIQITKEICKTLIKIVNYVHSNQVVHRDIKLENVLIDKNGRLVLCDFGFAELLTNTTAKRTVGTLSYMPPELHQETMLGALNSETINTNVLIKSDVFSLGVTLFLLLLGFMPFQSSKPSSKCKLWKLIQQKKWQQYWTLVQKLSKQQIQLNIQDFLQQFLQPDYTSRGTLDVIYNHPFLQDVKDDVQLI